MNSKLEVKEAEGIYLRSLTYPDEPPPPIYKVEDVMWTLKSNKVPGMDNIQAELIQSGGKALIWVYHTLVNVIWESGKWSKTWTQSLMVPIPKKGDQAISLLTHQSKILLHIILKRIAPKIKNFLAKEQAGFGPKRAHKPASASGFPPPTPDTHGSGGAARCGRLPRTGEPEAIIADIQKKITDAFEVFDHECNKTVDVREIGTIIRSLGCCPSEGELHDMLAEVEEEEPTGYIRLEKFLPMMTKVLMERRYRPIPEDVLLRAFEVLDANKCGHLTKEELVKYMTEEGEPFTQEEMEEMLSAAVDPETNTVRYRDYITMMVVDEN
ncbi:dynein regulatory complex protein 8 [Terrapene carolina triunguis]|nr:dynein regulatory complex protein 8 [Terrapene carolina triunguis]